MPRNPTTHICTRCGVTFTQHSTPNPKFCSRTCYRKWRQETVPPLADRFWPKVDKTGDCWVWTARTSSYGYGLIAARAPGLPAIRAHRAAWEFASGETAPSDAIVAHTCDNPPCVRNDEQGTYEVGGRVFPRFGHLFLTDDAGNMADCQEKGRMGYLAHPESILRGERHWSHLKPELIVRGGRSGPHMHPERMAHGERVNTAKLTAADVQAIRAAVAAGGMTLERLGQIYGIQKSAVSKIVRRQTWDHIP
jgi:hypothetical protein